MSKIKEYKKVLIKLQTEIKELKEKGLSESSIEIELKDLISKRFKLGEDINKKTLD